MADHSRTPLFKKLGYKPGFVAHVGHPPDDYLELVRGFPDDVRFVDRPESVSLDLAHLFAGSRQVLESLLPVFVALIKRDGMIWVSWPKKASKVPTDMTADAIREVAFPLGLVDVKVCAVDAVWSGLKLMIRKEMR